MTSVYGLVLRRKAYGQYFHSYFDHLQQTQWLSDAEMAAYQAEQVRSFLECASLHSAYWRDQFHAVNFNPARYRSPEDLHRWIEADG
jgi:phenylacetate-coenzyme A ligase PaaK-like adenylate-forming protein